MFLTFSYDISSTALVLLCLAASLKKTGNSAAFESRLLHFALSVVQGNRVRILEGGKGIVVPAKTLVLRQMFNYVQLVLKFVNC